jgi:hypothetical protein
LLEGEIIADAEKEYRDAVRMRRALGSLFEFAWPRAISATSSRLMRQLPDLDDE